MKSAKPAKTAQIFKMAKAAQIAKADKVARPAKSPVAADLPGRAAEASRFLRMLANEKRLMTLCQLIEGERNVGELAGSVGLSPSALSQHLSRLRRDGLVATRRDAQTIYYRLAD